MRKMKKVFSTFLSTLLILSMVLGCVNIAYASDENDAAGTNVTRQEVKETGLAGKEAVKTESKETEVTVEAESKSEEAKTTESVEKPVVENTQQNSVDNNAIVFKSVNDEAVSADGALPTKEVNSSYNASVTVNYQATYNGKTVTVGTSSISQTVNRTATVGKLTNITYSASHEMNISASSIGAALPAGLRSYYSYTDSAKTITNDSRDSQVSNWSVNVSVNPIKTFTVAVNYPKYNEPTVNPYFDYKPGTMTTSKKFTGVPYKFDLDLSVVDQEGYDFKGWKNENGSYTSAFDCVTSDLTIVASYEIQHFTVKFNSANIGSPFATFTDGSTEKSFTVDYGKCVRPVSNNPAQKVIKLGSFKGWFSHKRLLQYNDPAYDFATPVKRNMDLYAHYYTGTGKNYGELYYVTFVKKNADGSEEVLKVAEVNADDDVTKADIPSLTPIKGYTWSWDKSLRNVSSNMTVTAVSTINTYKVKFLKEKGSSEVLGMADVKFGNDVAEKDIPAAPVVDKHEFTRWSSDITNVEGNLEVYPLYQKNVFSVTFLNEDGSELKTVDVNKGDEAAKCEIKKASLKTPADKANGKPATITEYIFDSWNAADKGATYSSRDLADVQQDMVFKPSFLEKKVVVNPVITFLNDNMALVARNTVDAYGKIAVPSKILVKDDNNGYSYEFKGWAIENDTTGKVYSSEEVARMDAIYDLTFIASYKEIKIPVVDPAIFKKYKVTFIDYNNNVIDTISVDEGNNVTVPSAPKRAEDNDYTYTFAGWKVYGSDKVLSESEIGSVKVKADVTYIANYKAVNKAANSSDTQKNPQVLDAEYSDTANTIDNNTNINSNATADAKQPSVLGAAFAATGDSAPVFAMIVLLAISGLGIVFIVGKRKQKNNT